MDPWDRDCLQRDRAAAWTMALMTVLLPLPWTVFDRMLEPDRWVVYLMLRLVMVTTGVAITAWLWHERSRVQVDVAIAVIVAATGGCIAWMLPTAVNWYEVYVLGFSVVSWGCGLVYAFPAWRMAIVQGALVGLFAVAHVVQPHRLDPVEVAGASFYLVTAGLICVAASQVRYNLYRSTFEAHQALLARERDLARAQLEGAEERAANRAKSAFLARMSHELRTPLNAILGYAELLGEDLDDAGVTIGREDLQRIGGAGRHLLALIDDVLDLSRVEAGDLVVEHERVDLVALAREVADAARPMAVRQGLVLELEATGELWIDSDRRRLRQILLNLVSNALKFTERGAVTVGVTGGAEPRLWVRDTGPGIAADRVEHLFEPFVQGDDSTTRRHEGSGLGLTIVRELAQRLHGRVEVLSEVGRGTTFVVHLSES
ncbi:MAG: HAMP domain-containing histidine kinase [Alphaproteobacteria bacterium]|nr:HAMP domain-containing histidine kinase [Alphaproteobacteria bacterium]